MYRLITKIIENTRQRIYTKRRKRFASFFNLSSAHSLLDISCGNGDELRALHIAAPNIQFHGIDMSKSCINKAKEKYPWCSFTVGLAEALPYGKSRFDAILSCMALHHYQKPVEVYKEVARVMSLGGSFYIIDTIPSGRIFQWLYNLDACDEPYHFERYCTEYDIQKFAESAGLYVTSIVPMRKFDSTKIVTLRKL